MEKKIKKERKEERKKERKEGKKKQTIVSGEFSSGLEVGTRG